MVIGQVVTDIYKDFGNFWRSLTSESQLRWVGPEKGVTHLATAAIINALWDLWAKLRNKPVWLLLCDLEPEQLVSTIDFRYLSNVITKEEALELLKKGQEGKEERLNNLLEKGYPAYTTQAGKYIVIFQLFNAEIFTFTLKYLFGLLVVIVTG